MTIHAAFAIVLTNAIAQPQGVFTFKLATVHWSESNLPQDDNFCLDLPGGNAESGQPVWLWECNGLENQNWIFADGSIKPTADQTKCLDIVRHPFPQHCRHYPRCDHVGKYDVELNDCSSVSVQWGYGTGVAPNMFGDSHYTGQFSNKNSKVIYVVNQVPGDDAGRNTSYWPHCLDYLPNSHSVPALQKGDFMSAGCPQDFSQWELQPVASEIESIV